MKTFQLGNTGEQVSALCLGPMYYGSSVAPEQAYQQILADSGRLYDPMVIEAFKTAWPAILERLREDAHQ